ncbi:MAG: universal stress protein [Bacteroidota bacterium]
MSLFNRLLIAADLSDMDDHLFGFTQQLIEKAGAEKIYPVHIIPDFTQPEKPILEFHKRFTMGAPVDEKARELLEKQVEGYFADMDVELAVEVVEGRPYRKLLHMAEAKEVNLVVAGVKRNSEHSGITAKRLARHLACDLLLVPEKQNGAIDRLVVPIDGSDNSARALQFALRLRRSLNLETQVEALHVVHMLPAAHYYGIGEMEELRQMVKEGAEKTCQDFLKQYEFDESDVALQIVSEDNHSTAEIIHNYTHLSNTTLLIIGAQGHSALSSFVFGSVTEAVVDRIRKVPLMIIR